MRRRPLRGSRAAVIAGVYLLAAVVWIVVSDPAFDQVAAMTGWPRERLEVAKGIGFVLVTAAVLYLSLRRWFAQLSAAAAEERAALEEQARWERLRANLLVGVSHELRTPLTAILGFSRTLAEHGDTLPAAQVAELGQRLTGSSRRLERLVLDLLEVDPLLDDQVSSHREPVELAALATRAVDAVDTGERVVEIHVEPVGAWLDVARVERALQHLVDNVLRHTPDGSPIEIVGGPDGERGTVWLAVADRGPGFPAPLLGTAFEVFIQDESVAGRASPGIGVGLAVVARCAAVHGGSARVAARPGGGAVVELSLPAG